MWTLGYRITSKRQDRGVTQAELALKAGIPQPNLSNIEKDKQDLTVTTLRKIAYALEVPMTFFFEEEKSAAASALTRPLIEKLARAAALGGEKLNPQERQITGWLRDILPVKSVRKVPVKKMYRSWMELKRRFGSSAIQTLCERVKELSGTASSSGAGWGRSIFRKNRNPRAAKKWIFK